MATDSQNGGKLKLAAVLALVLLAAAVAWKVLSGDTPPVQPPNAIDENSSIIVPEEIFAAVRFQAEEMELSEPMRAVADAGASGGKAIETPADHPEQLRPGGLHKHLYEHYPESFDALSEAERERCARLKKAVEVDHKFAFDRGAALRSFEVKEEGDYRIYMRVQWCCACGNSFYFAVDDGPLQVFSENGGTYGRWIWGFRRRGGRALRLHLAPGTHTLKVAYNEGGARLDQVLLTTRDDDDWIPTKDPR